MTVKKSKSLTIRLAKSELNNLALYFRKHRADCKSWIYKLHSESNSIGSVVTLECDKGHKTDITDYESW